MTLAVRDPMPLHRFVFDGQSHAIFVWPVEARDLTERAIGLRMIPYARIAIGGTGVQALIPTLTARLSPYIGKSTNLHYSIIGGTTDLQNDRTGAQIYADMGTLADNARTLGVTSVTCTTVPDALLFTAPRQAERASANALILADASAKFDQIWDFSGACPSAADPLIYTPLDGVHLTEHGAVVAATAMAPTIVALVA